MNERLYLGVEIGGTKTQVVLGNTEAQIIDRRRFAVQPAEGAQGILQQISRAVSDFTHHHRLNGVGIGFGGPVNWRTGQIACSHHIEGWSGFDIAKWMENLAHAPVVVDNDANTASLAEAIKGAGVDANPVFYVTLGSGVGGGLTAGGQIFHGAMPGEAEIGHVRLERSGITVEQRCSGWALDKRIRAEAAKSSSTLKDLMGPKPGGESRFLKEAVEKGDGLAVQIFQELCADLAFGLSHVTHLIHPEKIILGGGISLMGQMLAAGVEEKLKTFTMEAFRPVPKVCIAALGEDVVPVGALLLAQRI